MVKSLIWSVTLYASETWTLRKEDIKILEAFEMWIWRRIERINWMEHWKNVDVLLLVNEERSLIDTIRQRQKNWIGHILRGESLLRTVLEGRIPGKKTRGRPRMMLLDWMMDGERKMNYRGLKMKSSTDKTGVNGIQNLLEGRAPDDDDETIQVFHIVMLGSTKKVSKYFLCRISRAGIRKRGSAVEKGLIVCSCLICSAPQLRTNTKLRKSNDRVRGCHLL